MAVADGRRSVTVDEIIGATGFRPDFSFARELQLGLDPAVESAPALAPMIDPNLHSCGTVRPHGHCELSHPENGFHVADACRLDRDTSSGAGIESGGCVADETAKTAGAAGCGCG